MRECPHYNCTPGICVRQQYAQKGKLCLLAGCLDNHSEVFALMSNINKSPSKFLGNDPVSRFMLFSLVHQRVSNSWLWHAGSRQQKRHRQDPKLCCSMWHLWWTWILQIYDSEYNLLLGNTYGFLLMLHVVWVWPMEPLPGKRPKDPHSSPEFQTATLPNLSNHFHLSLSSFCQQSLKQKSQHAMWHEAKETTSTWIFSGQPLLRDTTSFFRSKWPMFGQLLSIQKRMYIPYTIDTSRKTHWTIPFSHLLLKFIRSWKWR